MPIDTFRETGFRVPKLTRLDVRKSAQALLDYMTIHYGWQKPYVPIVDLIELWGSCDDSGEPGCAPNYDVVEDAALPDCAAEFIPGENLLRIRQAVWNAATDGVGSDRETLAHEMGHIVLGHPPPSLARAYNYFHRVEPETDSEYQANWFLDEFLMDVRGISIADGVSDLVKRFGVSEAGAARRIHELILERAVKRTLLTKPHH